MTRRASHISTDHTVGYLHHRAIIHTGIKAAVEPIVLPAKPPVEPVDKNADRLGEVAAWGSDNLFPQNVLKDAEKDPFIYPLIEKKIRMLYGSGVEVGLLDYDDNGKELFLRGPKYADILNPVKTFANNAGVNKYLLQAISDMYWFNNTFPQMIRNIKGDQIVNLHAVKTSKCRWMIREANELVSKKCFVNGSWANGGSAANSTTVDVLDPDNFPVETLRESKLNSFIYPMSFPSPDRDYYTLASWNVYRTSLWFQFVKKIPEFKVAMMNNSMVIRWHVEINEDYWSWRFPEDWTKAQTNSVLRQSLVESVFTEIDEMITGTEKAGKAIYTHVLNSKHSREPIAMITIKRLDDNLKFGEMQEDSSEASSFAIFSQGMHPTLVGNAPGSSKSSMGAGSGSDQRVAWNNYLSQCGMDMDMVFSPLYFARDFNGWDPRITWRFKHTYVAEPQQTAS